MFVVLSNFIYVVKILGRRGNETVPEKLATTRTEDGQK